MTDSLLCCNSCGWYHFDYVFMKHCLYLKKKAVKIGAPKSWPSYHYSSVASTDCLQLESLKMIEIGAVVHEIL